MKGSHRKLIIWYKLGPDPILFIFKYNIYSFFDQKLPLFNPSRINKPGDQNKYNRFENFAEEWDENVKLYLIFN